MTRKARCVVSGSALCEAALKTEITDILWTLTSQCNLTCSYCAVRSAASGHIREPSAGDIATIIRQLESLPNLESLVLTGGEALLSPHLREVLEWSSTRDFRTYVITNGTTLNDKSQAIVAQYRPCMMITMDSLNETENARTRGSGTLSRALESLSWCQAEDLDVVAISVITVHNIATICRSIERLYEHGVRNFLLQQLHCWSASLARYYRGASPSPERFLEMESCLRRLRRLDGLVLDSAELCFFLDRPRQYVEKCRPNRSYLPQRMFMCGAGFKLFAIRPDGSVVPCNAFWNYVVGNLLEGEVEDILVKSPRLTVLRDLRNRRVDEIPGCSGCKYAPICDGGCRADALNVLGDIAGRHPYCPYGEPGQVK
ncbi:MAG: radical SAM protein [Planctomycetota bacterium]|nr:radical SAM protein [Planctomycetota bacterium]